MTIDISASILAHISSFAIGLVRRAAGAGSTVLGSGVLVSIGGRRGILTCGHVAEVYEKLSEIGVVHFSAGGIQRRMVPLGDTQTIILQSGQTWSKKGLDLAFTQLPPDVASSIEAQSVFLNIEKNRAKLEAAAPAEGKHVDAMLGLVAGFSEKPFIEGQAFISPMRVYFTVGTFVLERTGSLPLTLWTTISMNCLRALEA